MLHSWRRAAALAAPALLACADVGPYVWARDYRAEPAGQKGFVIGPGDLLQVRMFGQEAFSTRARVRSDGKVSLPLLNDVEAAGYTPLALGQQLETRYKDFVKVPAVTISVEEVRPLSVAVAGEVAKPGMVSTDRGATLLQVLLMAGGLTDFAHRDRIFVLRGAQPMRIRFTWESLLRGEPASARFEIASGDTVVVE
jgi:polysaccharide export outer membrane protein